MTKLSCTMAPLLTTNRLNAPLLPTLKNVPPTCQRALGLANRTSLDLAVVSKPMVPLPELVSSALSDNTSSVNAPLVPTVTSPVMLVVTLLNVLVAPSATICAQAVPQVALNRAKHKELVNKDTKQARRHRAFMPLVSRQRGDSFN